MNRIVFGIACIGMLAACDGNGTIVAPGTDPEPASVEVIGGADQRGPVGSALADPVTVEVRDAEGVGVADVDVAWSVDDDGTVPATSRTDAQGRATADWTLGSTVGTQTLTGTVEGLDPVQIQATGEAVAAECEAGSAALLDETTSGTLTDACVDDDGRYYYTHLLDIDSTRTVALSSASDAFSPHMEIRDSRGLTVLPDSTGDASNRVALGPGSYGVTVRTSLDDVGVGGDYTLDLVTSEIDPGACGDETFITVRASVVGGFASGDCEDASSGGYYDVYPAMLMQDAPYTITLSASEATRVEVVQYDVVEEEWVVTDEMDAEAAGSTGYELSFTVTEPGLQYIRVHGADATDYSFMLDEVTDADA